MRFAYKSHFFRAIYKYVFAVSDVTKQYTLPALGT